MAVIVTLEDSKERYVLLGTGYGSYKALKPNWFWGNLVADKDEDSYPVAALADRWGKVGWTTTENLSVVSIDGRTPREILDDSDTGPT